MKVGVSFDFENIHTGIVALCGNRQLQLYHVLSAYCSAQIFFSERISAREYLENCGHCLPKRMDGVVSVKCLTAMMDLMRVPLIYKKTRYVWCMHC